MVLRIFGFVTLLLVVLMPAHKAEATEGRAVVAVATNFLSTADALAKDFNHRFDLNISLVSGSSGKLYAQIRYGAPFDVFLSADQARPEQLVDDGLAHEDARFTYAVGRLVLWSQKRFETELVRSEAVLMLSASKRIAYANEALAPYGFATVETLKALDLFEHSKSRMVRGENVGQAYGLVSSGNADVGFIAMAQLTQRPNKGSYWLVDETLHTPIRQDAILLNRGADNAAAQAFISYLRSDAAQGIIRNAGYRSED